MNVLVKPLAIALLCAGCATQTYEAKPLEPQRLADAYDARRLDNPQLQDYMVSQGYPLSAFPIKQWGLRELTLAAFYYHPALDVARAQWKAAQATQIIAAQKPEPGVSTQFEHHSDQDGGVSPWTYGFSFDIPIERSDKRSARMERAASLTEAARIDIAQTAWQVRSHLQSELLDYAATLRRIDLLQQEIRLREEIVQMLQNRLDAGMVSDLDLNQARLQLQKSRQLMAAQETSLPVQRARLAAAAGVPAEALQAISLDISGQTPKTPAEANLQRAAMLNRLDIRAALLRYDAAEAKLRLEIARQYPDIVLSPGYIYDQGDNLWTFGLSMVLNLLNKNEGPIAEARAQRELEASQFLELQTSVVQKLEQAEAAYQSARQDAAKQEKLLEAQRHATALALKQFDAGYTDRLELTGHRLEEVAASQALQEATLRVETARHALENAMQQPLDAIELPALPEPENSSNES